MYKRQAFVNMTDPHGRTPVMWVCYANYNNIETTLKLEAKRAPYLGRLLEDIHRIFKAIYHETTAVWLRCGSPTRNYTQPCEE